MGVTRWATDNSTLGRGRARTVAFLLLAALAGGGVGVAEPDPESTSTESSDIPWHIEAETFLGRRGGDEIGEFIDVRITHEGLSATADRGRWNQSSEVATLVGRVKLTEASSVVTCDSLIYRRASELAFLFGDVIATDVDFRAEGDSARVDRNRGRVSLFGRAKVVDESGTIEASRVDYDRESGIAVARRDVIATDDESGTVVTGQRLVYNRGSGIATMTGEPELTSARGGESQLTVRAEELSVTRGSRSAVARRGVEIDQGEVRATAELAEIFEDDGWIRLTGRPVTHDPGGHIEADTMLVWYVDRSVDSLHAIGNVALTHEPRDKPGERTDAYGDFATAWFADGRISKMLVRGHAISDHYPSDFDLAAGSGVNHSRSDSMLMRLKDGRLDTVELRGEASGRYWFEPETGRAKRRRGDDPTNPAYGRARPGPVTTDVEPTVDSTAVDTLGAEIDTTQAVVLTVADVLTTVATPDSAVADTMPSELATWRDRTGSLDAVAAPDTLFPYEMDTVTYTGDRVKFFVETNDLALDGHAALQYGDAWLRAGSVIFDVDSETVEANDDPVLTDPGSEITGFRMDYDVDEQEGVVHHGRTGFDGGYYYGVRIKKLKGDVLIGESCTYTTCDRLRPHFHFLAKHMKIRVKDKVIARPVVLHVADIPVLALPYFMFPIKRGGRGSGWLQPQLEVGTSARRGRYIRNLGYYWAASEYFDVTAWGEFTERDPRWLGNVRAVYNKRYVMDGYVYLTGAVNLSRRVVPETDAGSRRWQFEARHKHTLNRSTRLSVNANFISSRSFRLEQDIGTSYETQVDRQMNSRADLSKTWGWGSANLSVFRNQDLEAEAGQREITASLPSLRVTMNTRPIGRPAEGRERGFLPFLSSTTYGYSFRTERPIQKFLADSTEGDRTTTAFAVNQQLSVSDSRKLGAISVRPNFSYNEYLFEEANDGKRWQRAGRWSFGAALGTALYGTLNAGIGPLRSIRHVMTPNASYSYSPDVTGGTFVNEEGVEVPRFSSVGGISFGNASRASRVSMTLNNSFQAKLTGTGEDEEPRKVDLMDVNVSTAYNFEADDRRWSAITSSLNMRPASLFDLRVSMRHDPYAWSLTSMTIGTSVSLSGTVAGAIPAGGQFDLGAGSRPPGPAEGLVEADVRSAPGQPWRLGLNHSFSYTRGFDSQSTVNGTFSFSPTENWRLSYRANANLREGEILSHSYSLTRDLHCWRATFERQFSGTGASYYFRINVIDIPEIKYEQRRNN